MLNYLQLYRIDAFIIYAGSYVFGALLTSGEISFLTIGYAILIASLPVNFVYSLNSISDRHIDKINKPHRPLPSGKISLTNAKIYVTMLLVISLPAGPLFESMISMLCYYLILLLGILYSNPVYPFKRNKYLSVICTSALLIAPMLIAVAKTGGTIPGEFIPLILFIYLFLLITIPLKDIEDVEGDIMNKSQNWYGCLGMRLVYVSALLNLLLAAGAWLWMPLSAHKPVIVVFFLIQLSVTLLNLLNHDWINSLYKQKIFVTIVYMVSVWVYQNLK
ncbi:MAG TPA: UbiA family prenyltransferase [Chitinophagales bacterium]|nr:UbiA family prenyltransferase [Chitinophagales bacterium]